MDKTVHDIDQSENENDNGETDLSEPQKRKSIQSVEVGIRVLNALAEASSALRLREIASLSGLSRSQAHRYLLSYVNTEMVHQEPETGQYELGPLAIKVGLAALRRSEATQIGGDALVQLVEQTGLTGQLVVWGDFGPTLVRQKTGRKHVPMALQVGSVVPILSSSAGQVFIAYLNDAVASEAARKEWQTKSLTPPNGWKTLIKKYQYEVRDAGYAAVDSGVIPGLSAISAPILNPEGQITLCLTMVAHESERITEKSDIIDLIRVKAEEASRRLGYSPLNEID